MVNTLTNVSRRSYTENRMKPKQVASILNVHVKTLQRWDKSGVFPAKRTPTNRRFYTEDMLERFLNGNNNQKTSTGAEP